MGHEILEEANINNAIIYFELLELMGFACIVLFAYDWYLALKLSVQKKALPYELTDFARQ